MIKKILKIALLVLLGLAVLGTFVFLWHKSRPEKTVYEIVSPARKTIEQTSVATGKIEPRNAVAIKPQISGIISAIYKKAGDRVKAGDVIALIKVIPDVSMLNAAENRVNIAQIEMKRQEAEYKRNKQLYDDKVLSASEFETSMATYLTAKEELQNAIDNRQIVKEGIATRSGSYSNTQIRATIAGTVLDVPVKVGNSVIQANTFNDGTTIATIADMSDMIFSGKIDETEVGRVHVGMPIKLTIGALQHLSFGAELEYIAPQGVEENGAIMFEMKAAAHIPDSVQIRAGYSANAAIILMQRKDVLTVPENTVIFEHDSSFVYCYKGMQGNEQQFERKPITVGISDGIDIEVLTGIDEKTELRGNKRDTDKTNIAVQTE